MVFNKKFGSSQGMAETSGSPPLVPGGPSIAPKPPHSALRALIPTRAESLNDRRDKTRGRCARENPWRCHFPDTSPLSLSVPRWSRTVEPPDQTQIHPARLSQDSFSPCTVTRLGAGSDDRVSAPASRTMSSLVWMLGSHPFSTRPGRHSTSQPRYEQRVQLL